MTKENKKKDLLAEFGVLSIRAEGLKAQITETEQQRQRIYDEIREIEQEEQKKLKK
jgi:hypothetical protein